MLWLRKHDCTKPHVRLDSKEGEKDACTRVNIKFKASLTNQPCHESLDSPNGTRKTHDVCAYASCALLITHSSMPQLLSIYLDVYRVRNLKGTQNKKRFSFLNTTSHHDIHVHVYRIDNLEQNDFIPFAK